MTYKIIPVGHENIDYEQNENENFFLDFYLIFRKHSNWSEAFFLSNIEITLRCKIAKVEKIKIYPVEKWLWIEKRLTAFAILDFVRVTAPGFSHLWTMGTSRWQRRTLLRAPLTDDWQATTNLHILILFIWENA